MISELDQLKNGAMISIDDEISKQFTGREDFVVNGTSHYDVDGVDVVIAELEDHFLIVTCLNGDITCTICEEFDESIDCFENDDFAEEITLCIGEDDVIYQKGQAAYATEDTPSFCEYSTFDHHLDYLLISENEDVVIYRGLAITQDSVIL